MSEDLNSISRDLGRVEGKLDSFLLLLNEHIKKDEAAWERVSYLEKKVVFVAGVWSTITFLVTSGIFAGLRKIGLIS